MDKIQKALEKLSSKERQKIKSALERLHHKQIQGLDIKKLKDRSDIFRLRLDNLRVIYQELNDEIIILQISRRNENTYK